MHAAVEQRDPLGALVRSGAARGRGVALTLGARFVGLAGEHGTWWVPSDDPIAIVSSIEDVLAPRWVWWSSETATRLVGAGLRVSKCWDVAAVHRVLFGGWKADPARVWAALRQLDTGALPSMGQLGLLDDHGDDGGDPDDPVRADGHLRPEWTSGGWMRTPEAVARWAELAWRVMGLQREELARLTRNESIARSESAAELLCAELAYDGLPVDRDRAEAIVGAVIGPRPVNEADEVAARRRRDDAVLVHARSRAEMELRNPAHVRSMLVAVGVNVTDTRAWRLEPFRGTHPFVDALLHWRKAERMATTYGYAWLDHHVGADGRLRGSWTGCDGAAGRMTASAGLHNMPADMRDAVVAEPGCVFVHADLGQIEPRVLAAVSGDASLSLATQADDLYAPIAQRLGVERPVAKVAVLAAMYGQTSGTAGEALRGLEAAYPTAMAFLRDADRSGQAGTDVRTYGGRLVRMGSPGTSVDMRPAAAAARGRYARNAVVQGAAAELFKAWAVTLRGRLSATGATIVLCLHDELLVHVPAGAAADASSLLEAALTEAAFRWMPGSSVRYVAKARVVRRWSDAK